MIPIINQIKIPDGFTKEPYCNADPERATVIEIPKQGGVTIHWNERRWSLGYGRGFISDGNVGTHSTRQYKGRNWRQILAQDACSALKKAVAWQTEQHS